MVIVPDPVRRRLTCDVIDGTTRAGRESIPTSHELDLRYGSAAAGRATDRSTRRHVDGDRRQCRLGVGSIGVVVAGRDWTALGVGVVLAQAGAVAVFAELEWLGLRRATPAG